MPDPPNRPADPRPHDEPYYIESECPACGTPLALYDAVHETDGPVWHDEWVCPACDDGIHLDVPGGRDAAPAPETVAFTPLDDG